MTFRGSNQRTERSRRSVRSLQFSEPPTCNNLRGKRKRLLYRLCRGRNSWTLRPRPSRIDIRRSAAWRAKMKANPTLVSDSQPFPRNINKRPFFGTIPTSLDGRECRFAHVGRVRIDAEIALLANPRQRRPFPGVQGADVANVAAIEKTWPTTGSCRRTAASGSTGS
jgi:hypothetical protein